MFIIHTNRGDHNVNNDYVTSIQEHEVIMHFPSIDTAIGLLNEGIVSLTFDRGRTAPVIKARAVGTKLTLNL